MDLCIVFVVLKFFSRGREKACPLGYNEFDFFLENKEYRPFDGCKIEI